MNVLSVCKDTTSKTIDAIQLIHFVRVLNLLLASAPVVIQDMQYWMASASYLMILISIRIAKKSRTKLVLSATIATSQKMDRALK